MAEEKFVKVAGTGSFLPGDPIPFDKIGEYLGEFTEAPRKVMRWVERSKPLMMEMLDIDHCYYAIDPQTKERTEDHVTMSVKSAKIALEAANLKPEDVDLITFGSPFMEQIPPITTRIQEALGIDTCAEMAIHSNCTSAYKALMVAHDTIRNGRFKNALVLSTSINSAALRANYFNQEILKTEDAFIRWFLCDGSGAIVLKASDTKSDGLYLEHSNIESIGGKKPSAMHNGWPACWENLIEAHNKGYHHMSQMFKLELREHMLDTNGITIFTNGIARFLEKYKIDISNLKFFQLNMPTKHIVEIILTECEDVVGIPRDILYTKVSNMGYPGPPAAFICLDKIVREETLNKNDMILSFVTEVSKFMQAGFTLVYY
jgi:3-oxoacyl-[acyl-carrier-protein] synthase III